MKLGKWRAPTPLSLQIDSSKEPLSLVWAISFLWYHIYLTSTLNFYPFPVFGSPDIFVSKVIGMWEEIIMSQESLLLQSIPHIDETWYLVSYLSSPPKHCINFWCPFRDVFEDFVFHKGITRRACVWSLSILRCSKYPVDHSCHPLPHFG